MRTEDNQIMNILYTPVMYVHPDNLAPIHVNNSILSDVLINYWIINQYQLDNIPDCWQPTDAIANLIFANWQMIPKAAFLIGSYLLRERLIIERARLMTDLTLLSFVSLPLRHTVKVSIVNEDIDYSAYGAAFILGLSNKLPVAVQQRFRLLFPLDMSLPQLQISKTPDHINLLKMAIDYARNSNK